MSDVSLQERLILAASCAWQWLKLAIVQPRAAGKAMATVTAKRLPLPCRQFTHGDKRQTQSPQNGWQSARAYLYPFSVL